MSRRSKESPRWDLWRHPEFLKLWAASAVSDIGSQVSALALPLIAALTLGASAWQMGLLSAAGSAPVLLVGLFAGVWVDRLRRRPVLIAADVGRAALLLVIPLASATGTLGIELLYAVTLLAGALTVLFDVAHLSFVPSLVGRERLVEGNSGVIGLPLTLVLAEFGCLLGFLWLLLSPVRGLRSLPAPVPVDRVPVLDTPRAAP